MHKAGLIFKEYYYFERTDDMSKVKEYYGTKSKALHRMRRFETRSKKLSRFRKYKNEVYSWYKGGYAPAGNWWLEVEILVNGHGHLSRYNCKPLKSYRNIAARHLRRHVNLDEENHEVIKGNMWKKDFDVEHALW